MLVIDFWRFTVKAHLPERAFLNGKRLNQILIAIENVGPEIAATDKHGEVGPRSAGNREVVLALQQVMLGNLIGPSFAPFVFGYELTGRFAFENGIFVNKLAVDVGNHPWPLLGSKQFRVASYALACCFREVIGHDVLKQIAPTNRRVIR